MYCWPLFSNRQFTGNVASLMFCVCTVSLTEIIALPIGAVSLNHNLHVLLLLGMDCSGGPLLYHLTGTEKNIHRRIEKMFTGR